MINIPILINHDQDNVIGYIYADDGQLRFEFSADIKITQEMLYEIFGNCGVEMEIEESGGNFYVKSGRFLEFSLL